jgi:hypothetical protein
LGWPRATFLERKLRSRTLLVVNTAIRARMRLQLVQL